MENESQPEPISESLEEALLNILRPDLVEQYKAEKERHKNEKVAIEQALKRARQWLKRLFGPVLEQRTAELEAEHLERVQGEEDRHAAWLAELRETIRDHLHPDRNE